MKLNYKQFNVLCMIYDGFLYDAKRMTNEYNILQNLGYVNDSGLTAEGEIFLNYHKVDNAVILAAGFGSRFRPFSNSLPKGLAKIKGEILIERIIRQLLIKDINNIYIVVGYMAEKFEYLREKFGVSIIYNPDYEICNNISSLYVAKNILKNTYILGSDNWYVDNPFNYFEYDSYFSRLYSQKYVDEYCVSLDEEDYIINIKKGGENTWYTLGEIYLSRNLSKQLKEDLEKEYRLPEVKNMIIDSFFQRHINTYKFYTKERDFGQIYEFDSMQEAIDFDPNFYDYAKNIIRNNINN